MASRLHAVGGLLAGRLGEAIRIGAQTAEGPAGLAASGALYRRLGSACLQLRFDPRTHGPAHRQFGDRGRRLVHGLCAREVRLEWSPVR